MIKEKIIVLLILAISLVAIANAVQDNIIMGPYKVSFDSGLKRGANYTVDNVTNMSGDSLDGYPESVYSALLKNSTSTINAEIDLIYADSPQNSTSNSSSLKTLMESGLSGYWTTIRWNNRTIDKMPGELAELKDSNGTQAYSAAYYLPNENETSVLIYSSWPWNTTAELLDTIHVERIAKAT